MFVSVRSRISFSLIFVLLFGKAFSQEQFKGCSKARGHYLELSRIDPTGSAPEADTVRFYTDLATKNYILGLSPLYLYDVRVDNFVLPEPPANSSAQTRAEIKYLLQLQKLRTPLDVQLCKLMAGISYNPRVTVQDHNFRQYQHNLFHIGRSIGTWYNAEQLPETAKLLANIYRDASFFIWSLKYKYARIRPNTIDPAIENLEDTDWPAYPSGHAANSYVTALVLSTLAPEFADIFMKDAYDMAHSREIIGVHFPSDSEASRIFSCQFVEKLFANDEFINDFERVRIEWREKAKERF